MLNKILQMFLMIQQETGIIELTKTLNLKNTKEE